VSLAEGRGSIPDLLMRLGLALALLAYFLVWLSQPVAGLTFIGVEMGEWVKFLPGVRAGAGLPSRSFFYAPPVGMGLIIVLWSVSRSNRDWRTWALRGLGVLVAMLALPSLEAVLEEPADQWVLRLALVVVVGVAALGTAVLSTNRSRTMAKVQVSVTGLLALAGGVLPAWAMVTVTPEAESIFGTSVRYGPGFWLNILGHGLILLSAIRLLGRERQAGSGRQS
jgi:hypothetical protein